MGRHSFINEGKTLPISEPSTYGDSYDANPTLRGDGRLNVNLDSPLVKYLALIQSKSTLHQSQSSSKSPTPYSESTKSDYLDPQPPPYSYSEIPHAPNTESRLFPVKLNIVIQVVGSRGDIQPFIALGTELQKHGHRVRLATHNVFETFVRTAGLEFYPIGGDPAELMAYMVRNPGLIPSMKSMRAGDIQKKRRMMAEILRGCWASCIEPDTVSSLPFVADAIIANPPSFAHVHCAQALGVPVHLMFTMPWSTTKAFPHPLANLKNGSGAQTEPRMANALSYAVVEFLTWQGLGDIINDWRETLDLEPISFSDGPILAEMLKIPFTYCWSPALVPKPMDWGSHIDVCGFFFRDPPDYTPSPELHEFLQRGPPPIYIGFGSIVIDDPQQLSAMILEAVRITGVRAIISRGWSNLDGPAMDNVLYLGDCPHEWLFKHVAAVIHHGGAGTTACGLVNGRPTAIVPFFGDQPFWGEMVAAAGSGTKPIPYQSLSTEKLVEAIQFCLTPGASLAAQGIAAKMKAESGVQTAVASFHANLPLQDLKCDIIKDQPAVWEYRGKRGQLRLSKVAADILASHLKVDLNKLKIYQTKPILIETQRWDPFTGTVSAAVGAGRDIMVSASDIVVKPAKVYREKKNMKSSTTLDLIDDKQTDVKMMDSNHSLVSTMASSSSSSSSAVTIKKENSRKCGSMTKAMTAASAAGVVGFCNNYATSLVTIPYAFTEGLRNVPRLYGEEVRDYGTINDWKSGTIAGAKILVYGLAEGTSDLVVLPYRGGQQEGGLGVVKGIGKGVIAMQTKFLSAVVGFAAYPMQGVYKSVRSLAKSKTRKSVILARRVEGLYLARRAKTQGIDDNFVMNTFDERK